MKRLAALGLAAFLTAGCSSDGPDAPTSSTAPSSPPSTSSAPSSPSAPPSSSSSTMQSVPPSSSPTTWSLSLSRTNFVAYLEPVNRAVADYADLGRRPALKPLKRSCSTLAARFATAARLLAAGMWPTDVRPKIDALVSGLARERGGWLLCAHAGSKAQAYSATRKRYHAAPLGETARIALGLPPA